jgi:hypothetical protein
MTPITAGLPAQHFFAPWYDWQTVLCPIFQSFLWHSVLQYLALWHPPHSLRVAGTPGSPGLRWQTAHSTRAELAGAVAAEPLLPGTELPLSPSLLAPAPAVSPTCGEADAPG